MSENPQGDLLDYEITGSASGIDPSLVQSESREETTAKLPKIASNQGSIQGSTSPNPRSPVGRSQWDILSSIFFEGFKPFYIVAAVFVVFGILMGYVYIQDNAAGRLQRASGQMALEIKLAGIWDICLRVVFAIVIIWLVYLAIEFVKWLYQRYVAER